MYNSHPFFNFLKERILHPLPGENAHVQMAPSPLTGAADIPSAQGKKICRNSVMILLNQPEKQRLEVLLTVRDLSLAHGGQISFPGGQCEPGESEEETALREMKEEVGIVQEKVCVIGSISRLYLRHTNNLITPVIGIHRGDPVIIRNPAEVQEVFTIPLDSLLDKNLLVKQKWELQKRIYNVPFWDIHHVPLWGATAMIINELLVLYREFLQLHQSTNHQ